MASAGPPQPLQNFVRIAFRQKRKMTQAALAVLVLAGLWTLVSSRAYRSQAKLFVRLGRENATLDPTATVGQAPVLSVQQSRENEINTAVEILKSRVLLEKVADAVGAGAILGESPASDDGREKQN